MTLTLIHMYIPSHKRKVFPKKVSVFPDFLQAPTYRVASG